MHASIAAAVCASFIFATFQSTENTALRMAVVAVAITMIVLVDYSRIAIGVHLPVDVVVGTLLGIGITVLVWQLPA